MTTLVNVPFHRFFPRPVFMQESITIQEEIVEPPFCSFYGREKFLRFSNQVSRDMQPLVWSYLINFYDREEVLGIFHWIISQSHCKVTLLKSLMICPTSTISARMYLFEQVAQDGNLELLQYWTQRLDIFQGATVNAFCRAAAHGHLHVVKWLTKKFGLVIGDRSGNTNRMIKSLFVSGNLRILRWAVKRFRLTIDSIKYNGGFSALGFHGHCHLLLWLLHYFRLPPFLTHSKDYKGNNFIPTFLRRSLYTDPFFKACQRGHANFVRWLLVFMKKDSRASLWNKYLLECICTSGSLSMVKLIFAYFQPSYHREFMNRALQIAASDGHFALFKWLYRRSTDCQLSWSLNAAIESGHFQLVRWMFKKQKQQQQKEQKQQSLELILRDRFSELLTCLRNRNSLEKQGNNRFRKMAAMLLERVDFSSASRYDINELLKWSPGLDLVKEICRRSALVSGDLQWSTFSSICASGDIKTARYLLTEFAPRQEEFCQGIRTYVFATKNHIPMLEWFEVNGVHHNVRDKVLAFKEAHLQGETQVMEWLIQSVINNSSDSVNLDPFIYGILLCPSTNECIFHSYWWEHRFALIAGWQINFLNKRNIPYKVGHSQLDQVLNSSSKLVAFEWVSKHTTLNFSLFQERQPLFDTNCIFMEWLIKHFHLKEAKESESVIVEIFSRACRNDLLNWAKWLARYFNLTAKRLFSKDYKVLRIVCLRSSLALVKWFFGHFQISGARYKHFCHNLLAQKLSEQDPSVARWLVNRFHLSKEKRKY